MHAVKWTSENFTWYSWFHLKGSWSVHSFNGDYLSIPSAHRYVVSWGNLFHEILGSKTMGLIDSCFFGHPNNIHNLRLIFNVNKIYRHNTYINILFFVSFSRLHKKTILTRFTSLLFIQVSLQFRTVTGPERRRFW